MQLRHHWARQGSEPAGQTQTKLQEWLSPLQVFQPLTWSCASAEESFLHPPSAQIAYLCICTQPEGIMVNDVQQTSE